MDSLTHIAIGAVIGEAILGKKVGNKALLLGAAISTIPDLDVIISPFIRPVNAIFFHRGISHSLFFSFLLIPFISWLIAKLVKKIAFRDCIILSSSILFVHLTTDCFNTYGTGILEPFSNVRVAYDSMSIIDIFILFPLIFLIIITLTINYKKRKRRILACSGLIFLTLYFGFAILNKINIESIIKKQLTNQNIKYDRILTTPLPLTNCIWMAVAESDNGYNTCYYGIFDTKKEIKFRYIARNNERLGSLQENPKIKKIIRFTKNYYSVDSSNNGSITIHDLRFSGLDLTNDKAFVFSFTINETSNGLAISRSHPRRSINLKSAKIYFKRVFNN